MSAIQLFKVAPITVPPSEPGGAWIFFDAQGNLCAKDETNVVRVVVAVEAMTVKPS